MTKVSPSLVQPSENESGNDIQSIISPTQYEKDYNDDLAVIRNE